MLNRDDNKPETTTSIGRSEWPAAFLAVGLALAFVGLMWVWSGSGACR